MGQANEALATARRLEKLGPVAAAARAGELSAAQLAALADAATGIPGPRNRLLGLVRRASLAELREECARTKAAAASDAEDRRRGCLATGG